MRTSGRKLLRSVDRQCLKESDGVCPAVAALLLGTLAAGPAWADLPYFVAADATATVGALDSQTDSTGQLQIFPVIAGPVSADGNPFSPDDSAAATSTADMGELTAYASANVTDGLLVLGRVGATDWLDTFTASSSNPDVTEVTFQATLSLFDTITASASTIGEARVDFILSDSAHIDPVTLLSLDDASFNPPLNTRTVTAMITEPIGVPFVLHGRLVVTARAGDPFGVEGFVVVDATEGATFKLDPTTPDGAYTTASGVSYLSPP